MDPKTLHTIHPRIARLAQKLRGDSPELHWRLLLVAQMIEEIAERANGCAKDGQALQEALDASKPMEPEPETRPTCKESATAFLKSLGLE